MLHLLLPLRTQKCEGRHCLHKGPWQRSDIVAGVQRTTSSCPDGETNGRCLENSVCLTHHYSAKGLVVVAGGTCAGPESGTGWESFPQTDAVCVSAHV